MPLPSHSSTFTSDYRQHFDAETESLLRRRFLWFSGLVASVALAFWLLSVSAAVIAGRLGSSMTGADSPDSDASPLGRRMVGWGFALLNVVVATGCFLAVKRKPLRRDDLIKASYLLLIADGLIRIILSRLDVSGSLGLLGVLLTHLLACCFLPWSPRQAIIPLLPVLIVRAMLVVTMTSMSWPSMFFSIALSPFVGLPGVIVCWLRDSRRTEAFKLQFFQKRYGEVRRELVDARRIHESMFPRPINDGPVLLNYVYEPMSQIGGDYVFAHRVQPNDDKLGMLSLVLMDVTGHGITAALTVNRLYGELTRVYAEQPFSTPGEVLRLLNRYIHLTLASHSVYVTALCVRADLDSDCLEYASGGHPPAFVRAVDGTIHELESTAIVLGACADPEFDADPRRVKFGPGDALIAYTDGAIEARGIDGVMLGLSGLRRLLASRSPLPGSWPATLLGAVSSHRLGPPADDTLVIELCRTLETSRIDVHNLESARVS